MKTILGAILFAGLAWGQCAGCTSGGGGGSSYDPTSVAAFDNTFDLGLLASGNASGALWATNALTSCGQWTSGNTAPAGYSAALYMLSAGNACGFVAPNDNGSLHSPFVDFLSGSTPLSFNLQAHFGLYATSSTYAGDIYVGWSQSGSSFSNFVGIKYTDSTGKYSCLIIKSGSIVDTTVMNGVTADTSLHWFRVSGNGTANSVTCQIGSVAAVTTTGSSGDIPSGNWFAVLMGNPYSGSTPVVEATEARIHIAGRAAN